MSVLGEVGAWFQRTFQEALSDAESAVVCATCVREVDRFTPPLCGDSVRVEPPVAEFGDYAVCPRCESSVTSKTPARRLRRFTVGFDCGRCPVCHAHIASDPLLAIEAALRGTEHRCDPKAVARILAGPRV